MALHHFFGAEALPEAPIRRLPTLADNVVDLREAGRWIRSLPYGRTSSPSAEAVLAEGCGTCSTKHALLASLDPGDSQGRPLLSLTVGIYLMSGDNTPGVGPTLERAGLAALPEAHCYVIYDGRRIDVTRSTPPAPFVVMREIAITPDQIGSHKAELHRAFFQQWLSDEGIDRDFDDLWQVREACIAALSAIG